MFDDDILAKLELLFYLLFILLYLFFMRYLEKRSASGRSLSDEEYLSRMAKKRGCSEYDVFCLSAEEWCVSEIKVERDFKEYLVNAYLPYYVNDYIRKVRKEEETH